MMCLPKASTISFLLDKTAFLTKWEKKGKKIKWNHSWRSPLINGAMPMEPIIGLLVPKSGNWHVSLLTPPYWSNVLRYVSKLQMLMIIMCSTSTAISPDTNSNWAEPRAEPEDHPPRSQQADISKHPTHYVPNYKDNSSDFILSTKNLWMALEPHYCWYNIYKLPKDAGSPFRKGIKPRTSPL